MVAETIGLWDASAAWVLRHLAAAPAAQRAYFSLLQELCVVIRSFLPQSAVKT